MTDHPQVSLVVADAALASLVASAATSTPGVRRLQPRPFRAARDAIASTVTRAGAALADRLGDAPGVSPEPIRSTGVEIDRDDAGTVTATVRVVVATLPPVHETVAELQRRTAAELSAIAGLDALVVIQVVDVEVRAARPTDLS